MMKKIYIIPLVLILSAFIPGNISAINSESQALPGEYISKFNSELELDNKGTLTVIETIEIATDSSTVKHGIYRDIPTNYKDKNGKIFHTPLEVISVKRDGHTEPSAISRDNYGVHIKIGDPDVTIGAGYYSYVLEYRVKRVITFGQDSDELYWNVTGNEWPWQIATPTVTFSLPSGKVTNGEAFAGLVGTNSQETKTSISENGVFTARATNILEVGEGLTLLVHWPKGVVQPPTEADLRQMWLEDNIGWIASGSALIIFFAFLMYIWFRRGRDNKPGTIIAQYDPPQGLSPAMMRAVSRQRISSGNTGLVVSLLHTSVLGKTNILEDEKNKYSVTILDKQIQLCSEEQEMIKTLSKTPTTIAITAANYSVIQKAIKALDRAINQPIRAWVQTNTLSIVINFLLSLLLLAITSTVIIIYDVTGVNAPFIIVYIIGAIILNAIFGRIMSRYTPEGRKLADEIAGFKLFLEVTEKDRLNFHNPPEKTPELFEKMLPYAVALGVEHKWSEQFTDVFKKLEAQGQPYSPSWYRGTNMMAWYLIAPNMSHSMSRAVSAAMPKSSGGGSSGGGFGGGGGGGW